MIAAFIPIELIITNYEKDMLLYLQYICAIIASKHNFILNKRLNSFAYFSVFIWYCIFVILFASKSNYVMFQY